MNTFELLAQLTDVPRLWYALPLLIAASLVYGATRDERTHQILVYSAKFLMWTIVFFAAISALIWFGGFWN